MSASETRSFFSRWNRDRFIQFFANDYSMPIGVGHFDLDVAVGHALRGTVDSQAIASSGQRYDVFSIPWTSRNSSNRFNQESIGA